MLIFASRYSLYNYNRTLESTFFSFHFIFGKFYIIYRRAPIYFYPHQRTLHRTINFCPATSSSPHYIHIHYFQLVFRSIAINHCCLSCNIIFHSSFLSSFYTLSNSISPQLPYISAHKVPPNFSNSHGDRDTDLFPRFSSIEITRGRARARARTYLSIFLSSQTSVTSVSFPRNFQQTYRRSDAINA